MARKESEGPMLTNREERADPVPVKEPYSHKKIFKDSYAELYQNKSNLPTFEPNKYEYIPSDPKRYDFETRKF
jgi:hypothetical protein